MSADLREPFRPTWNPENVFSGTAWHYARYRPHYPDEVIHLLVDKFQLDNKTRVLDLGCGPGLVALKLARYVAEVVALDPQEEMLREGKLAAASGSISNIIWMKGQSGDLPQLTTKIGNIGLTVIARAFHWMNQEQTLHDLFRMTVNGGGVAVISDNELSGRAKVPWREAIEQTVKKWLGEERKAGTEGTFSHPKKRFETYLRESEFGDYKEAGYTVERSWTLDEIVGYLYSTSSTSPPVLGSKKEAFEADLRERLQKIELDGHFKEQVEIVVNMAWKTRYTKTES